MNTTTTKTLPLVTLREAWEDREIHFIGGGNRRESLQIRFGEYSDGSARTVDVEQYFGPCVEPHDLPAVYIWAPGRLYPDDARALAAAILSAADLIDELLEADEF